jgi:hypothetical protein
MRIQMVIQIGLGKGIKTGGTFRVANGSVLIITSIFGRWRRLKSESGIRSESELPAIGLLEKSILHYDPYSKLTVI